MKAYEALAEWPGGSPMRVSALAAAVLAAATALAGCISNSEPLINPAGLAGKAFDTSRGWSVPLAPALYELLEPAKEFVPSFDGTPLAIGLFFPSIEGCDWGADALPETCRLAAVMDAGPYYLDRVAIDKFRPPTVEWLVPRGYVVVQMALRGTGESGGCMEYKSLKDVEDVSAVIDWLASQPWSNGNVGMIGRSYDGTAAWSGHAYPDRIDEHRNVRWDWAQRVLEWFDWYLKGQGQGPELNVEVEDTLFVWRAETTYPPRDAALRAWELGAGGALTEPGAAEQGSEVIAGGPNGVGTGASWTSEPVEQAVRVAGLPQLHVSVAPSTPAGGAVFVELYDVFPDGRTMRLGWAAMDLRFHAGGNTEPQPLVPGQAVLAMMEFEPVDALVARGHRLALVLHKNGVEDIEPSMTPDSLQVELGGGKSMLRLPLVERPTILRTYTPPLLPGQA